MKEIVVKIPQNVRGVAPQKGIDAFSILLGDLPMAEIEKLKAAVDAVPGRDRVMKKMKVSPEDMASIEQAIKLFGFTSLNQAFAVALLYNLDNPFIFPEPTSSSDAAQNDEGPEVSLELP